MYYLIFTKKENEAGVANKSWCFRGKGEACKMPLFFWGAVFQHLLVSQSAHSYYYTTLETRLSYNRMPHKYISLLFWYQLYILHMHWQRTYNWCWVSVDVHLWQSAFMLHCVLCLCVTHWERAISCSVTSKCFHASWAIISVWCGCVNCSLLVFVKWHFAFSSENIDSYKHIKTNHCRCPLGLYIWIAKESRVVSVSFNPWCFLSCSAYCPLVLLTAIFKPQVHFEWFQYRLDQQQNRYNLYYPTHNFLHICPIWMIQIIELISMLHKDTQSKYKMTKWWFHL